VKLSILQQRFVNNILCGMHQGEAYEQAGYKSRGSVARVCASQLLTNPNIQHAIQRGLKKAAERAEITQARLLQEESCIAFSTIGSIFELENGTLIKPNELPDEAQRAIAALEIIETGSGPEKTVKCNYKFWDKGKALERLERHLGV
jgi:phage terminase small subunit